MINVKIGKHGKPRPYTKITVVAADGKKFELQENSDGNLHIKKISDETYDPIIAICETSNTINLQ